MTDEEEMIWLIQKVVDSKFGSNSFTPRGRVTKSLIVYAEIILTVKISATYSRWKKFCEISCLKALSSHEMYLRYVMFACYIEFQNSDDVFHSILNVCALVFSYNVVVKENISLDFNGLILDIFMVFFKYILEKTFLLEGGFRKYRDYLLKESYSILSQFPKDSESFDDFKNLEEIRNATSVCEPEKYTHEEVINYNVLFTTMAKMVLSMTKSRLPILPSSDELKATIKANRNANILNSETQKNSMKTNYPTAGDSKFKIKKDSKLELTEGDSKLELSKRNSILEEAGEDSKLEISGEDSKLEISGEDSKLEISGEDSKLEISGKDSKLEVAGGNSKLEVEKEAPELVEGGNLQFERAKVDSTIQIGSDLQNFQIADVIESPAIFVYYDNLVRSVIEYNYSNLSNPVKAYAEIFKNSGNVLEHLKKTILSLIEVLNEVDGEIL